MIRLLSMKLGEALLLLLDDLDDDLDLDLEALLLPEGADGDLVLVVDLDLDLDDEDDLVRDLFLGSSQRASSSSGKNLEQ